MVWRSLKTLNLESPFDLAILLLGIQTKEVKTGLWTDTCISVFTGAFFMFVKRWKQPIYPSSGWMDKQNTVHTKDGILFIFEEKGNTDAAVTWMNLKNIVFKKRIYVHTSKQNSLYNVKGPMSCTCSRWTGASRNGAILNFQYWHLWFKIGHLSDTLMKSTLMRERPCYWDHA